MIEAIIFDCFGVIYEDSFEDVYASFGGDYEMDKEFLSKLFDEASAGRIEGGATAVIAKRLGVSVDAWLEGSVGVGSLNQQLLDYVDMLAKTYRIGLLSNIGPIGLGAFFDTKVLDSSFSVVVESAEIGFAKPEARAYEITAERLGMRFDECIMVDDREKYCEGARAIGMPTILYKDFEGFKKDLEVMLSRAGQ